MGMYPVGIVTVPSAVAVKAQVYLHATHALQGPVYATLAVALENILVVRAEGQGFIRDEPNSPPIYRFADKFVFGRSLALPFCSRPLSHFKSALMFCVINYGLKPAQTMRRFAL